MTSSLACTSSVLPKAPRGGKGADKRFAAYDAERARLASLYCGAASYEIARVTSLTRHSAAVSVWEGSRCLDGIGIAPRRFVSSVEAASAVNVCE